MIVFLLGSLPMIFGGFFQVAAGAMMFGAAKKVHGSLNADQTGHEFANDLDVTDHLDRRKRVSKGYLALRQPHEMAGLRSVSVTRTLPLKAFLERGEAMPAKEYREILISSRAEKVAMHECQIMQKKLADQCAVRNARGRLDKSGKKVSLSASYDFTQKEGIGNYDSDAPLRYVAATERIMRKGTVSESSRAIIYRKAAEMCGSVRRREGNCAVTDIRLSTGRGGRDLSASVTLSMLQRR